MKQIKKSITGETLNLKLKSLTPSVRGDIEAWVINSVKLNMISKMDKMLENQGRLNLRRLFLVPVFKIVDLEKRVKEKAPEIKTVFYRELVKVIETMENKLEA